MNRHLVPFLHLPKGRNQPKLLWYRKGLHTKSVEEEAIGRLFWAFPSPQHTLSFLTAAEDYIIILLCPVCDVPCEQTRTATSPD